MADWEAFYRERDYDRCAYLAGEAMVDHLDRFFERVGVPGTLLSVGCGPAVTEFALAERHPDLDVLAVDLSATVVADNRALAAERGLDNLSFAVDALPDLSTDGRFDLVYCVATLYFVEAVADALRALWARVAPGGYLVVNYPTEATREWAREELDPWRRDEFFHLVRDGANLLTREEVARATGGEARDYWAAVGVGDEPGAERAPTAYVRREP
ncbi:class I SAM-dependent methyltransferase [Halomarina halobia]|uniref:Class I SAM-dependent methyltransferase n=1 Tax=Halomarina halobia TaxID=3033386 RepID=A0ABD6AAL0_9EURY|nr:class I SAM-dependent methyltransferase [Halomarina sp. PSR21]